MKTEIQANVLSTQALSIGYKVRRGQVVCLAENLNLRMKAGELTCLLGRNGTGKSTLIRTLAMLHSPLSGEVLWNGSDPHELTPRARAREAAIVLTHVDDTGQMCADELVALGRYPYTDWQGRLSEHDVTVINRVFAETGSAAYRSRILNTLSDGERQRVSIARALAQETRLLFLDEPTAFLDLPGRASLMLLLRKIARERGLAILLSTHDLSLALDVADHLWLIENARQFYEGSPQKLVSDGTLERVFASDGIRFDSTTATLRLSINS